MRRFPMLAAGLALACGDPARPSPPSPAAAAQRLVFTVQPSDAAGAKPILPAVQVAVQDTAGRTLTDATPVITMSLRTNPGRTVLRGTVTARAVNGVATFANLSLDRPGTGYTLVATAQGMTTAISAPFAIHLRFAVLAASQSHTCATQPDAGPAFCWGWNRALQLGDDTADTWRIAGRVQGTLPFISITAGGRHTCAIAAHAAAYCWGSNGSGQLGDGSRLTLATPLPVAGDLEFVGLAGGYTHTCGLTPAGAAYCWGANNYGQLGDGSTTLRATPAAVAGGIAFTAVTSHAVGDHVCGLTADGTASCWGRNDAGQLGDGTTEQRAEPVAVGGGLRFVALSAGSAHTCGLTADGAAYCWGSNSQGQLGEESGVGPDRTLPQRVAGDLTFTAISGGGLHTCGLAEGQAYCWGENTSGQLGNGSTSRRTMPTAVGGAQAFVALFAGWRYSCGLTSTGTAYCWGFNGNGQLGTGSDAGSSVPAAVVQ